LRKLPVLASEESSKPVDDDVSIFLGLAAQVQPDVGLQRSIGETVDLGSML
jgi:hypothetical protein